MPRVPLSAPILAWERHGLPFDRRRRISPSPVIGPGKVVCYRTTAGVELCAFDIGSGAPIFRALPPRKIPSAAAFDHDGRVLLIEKQFDSGLITTIARSGREVRRSFAQHRIDRRYIAIERPRVCGGVTLAEYHPDSPARPDLVFGVPLSESQPEWMVQRARVVGAASRVFVLAEEFANRRRRLVVRSPGGEVLWAGVAGPATPVDVGQRVLVEARTSPPAVVGLDPESGRELFRSEVEGEVTGLVAGETSVAWICSSSTGGTVVAGVDLNGESIGSCALPIQWILAIDADRVLAMEEAHHGDRHVSAYRLGTPTPLWSVQLPPDTIGPVAFDEGFVARLNDGLAVFRSGIAPA